MTTMLITCPKCGAHVRAAVQPSTIEVQDDDSLYIWFDSQTVAHTCKEKK
jgi:hypothetical protein